MLVKDKLVGLKPGEFLMINAANIHHMMAGTRRVGVESNGNIKIQYEDNTIEEGKISTKTLNTDIEDITLFMFIDDVQSQRR